MRASSRPTLSSSLNTGKTTITRGWARIPVAAALVFVAAFCALAWDIDRDGIAAAYSDPVAQIRAQDEAIYVNSAIAMTEDGDWATPKVMGRLFFQKPPLLIWMTAASLKVFGRSLFAVRLPALLLGAAGVAAVFWGVAPAGGVGGGLFAAALLWLNPLWQIVSRLNYTDALASGFGAVALAAVAVDPKFEQKRSQWLFGASCAAAILAKSVAGLLPIVALGMYVVFARRDGQRWAALLKYVAIIIVIAAPWHIYQLLVHPRWFWADYVEQQLLGVGMSASKNGVFNRPASFWVERMWQLDPVLTVVAGMGLAMTLWGAVTRRNAEILLAWCWTVVVVAALAAFQAKNLPYLAFLLPPLCVLAGLAMARIEAMSQKIALAVVLCVCFAKMWFADGTRAIRYEAPRIESARAAREYYSFGRETELFILNPDDEFYSSTIPLPRVRYGFVDPDGAIAKSAPFYVPLGIILTTDQLLTLDAGPYLAKFRELGADGTKAIGTTILLKSPGDLLRLAEARPRADFSIPATWLTSISIPPTHDVRALSRDRVFLFSRQVVSSMKTPIELPQRW